MQHEKECDGTEFRALIKAIVDCAEHARVVHRQIGTIGYLVGDTLQSMTDEVFLDALSQEVYRRGYAHESIAVNRIEREIMKAVNMPAPPTGNGGTHDTE